MKGFIADIEDRTEENRDFRRVIYTGPHIQLVLMSLEPDGELGEEIHENTDQFFRFEEGKGTVIIDGQETGVESDTAVIVPAGTHHNIKNTGDKPLKFYTLYAPPQHPDGTVHHTREEAELAEHFAG